MGLGTIAFHKYTLYSKSKTILKQTFKQLQLFLHKNIKIGRTKQDETKSSHERLYQHEIWKCMYNFIK